MRTRLFLHTSTGTLLKIFNFLVKEVLTACTYAKTRPSARGLCAGWTGSQGWEDYLYLQFSQDTNTCQALDLSLPCAHRLFQQNHTDNHQVKLNLIKRGETLPRLIKFRVCCLKTVLAVEERHTAGSRDGEWRQAPGDDNQARQT